MVLLRIAIYLNDQITSSAKMHITFFKYDVAYPIEKFQKLPCYQMGKRESKTEYFY
jgi:hypothetical protein